MYEYEQTSFEDLHLDPIFDDTFFPESFYRDSEKRLGSIDLIAVINNETFLLTVESFPVHVERSVVDYGEDDSGQDDPSVYVVSREEILPSDILEIKTMLERDPVSLEAVLVKQTIEDPDGGG